MQLSFLLLLFIINVNDDGSQHLINIIVCMPPRAGWQGVDTGSQLGSPAFWRCSAWLWLPNTAPALTPLRLLG